ncbi:hypothetical protein, partial [Streptomyces nigra]
VRLGLWAVAAVLAVRQVAAVLAYPRWASSAWVKSRIGRYSSAWAGVSIRAVDARCFQGRLAGGIVQAIG